MWFRGFGLTVMLSDLEVSVLRFIDSNTAATPPNVWPSIWDENGLQDTEQLGMTSVRYGLAHMGYAVAALIHARTPAYTAPATRILRAIFARLIEPRVWSFWNHKGRCGAPFHWQCLVKNLSMADIQADNYRWQPSAAPGDPVGTANIMYSAHLAHIGLLYEALSGDDSLSTTGWSFGPHHYTLDRLVGALSALAQSNDAAGFGATCEPGSVFPSCNGHLHAALRLHAAVRAVPGKAPPGLASNLTKGWVQWAFEEAGAIWKNADAPGHNHCLFKIIRMQAQHAHATLGGGLPACASHDAWALTYLRTYMPPPPRGTEAADVQVRGVQALAMGPDWVRERGGAYLNSKCLLAKGDYYKPLGTAFFAAAVAQLPADLADPWAAAARQRGEEARAYIDSFGTALEGGRHYFYNTSYGMSLIATANRLLASALSGAPGLLYDLGAATRAGRSQPYLAHVKGAQALVRAARFLEPQRTLSVALEPMAAAGGGDEGVERGRPTTTTTTTTTATTTLEVSLLGARRVRSVLVNGSAATDWNQTAGETAWVSIALPAGRTTVDVAVE